MRSTLCEAVARCHLRRLRGVAASAPLPAAIVALVVVTAPVILFRLGGAVGDEVADSIGAAGVSDALVLGPLLAAAVAGAALAVATPSRSALGDQVAAGPSGAAIAVVALTLVPAAAGWIVVVPSLIALCAGLAHALPGGVAGGVALAAATLAAVPAGAVVAEGGLAAGRRHAPPGGRRGPRSAWGGVVVGLAFGAGPLGPLALVPPALRGAGSPWLALGMSSSVGIGLSAAWVVLAATRAEPRSRCRASGALQSTAPAGSDCRRRAARAERPT